MRSDHLKRHMKVHDKHGEVEALPSIASSYIPPEKGSSAPSYKLTSMDLEKFLKKLKSMIENTRTKWKWVKNV